RVMRSRLGVPSWRLTSLLVGAALGAASAAHPSPGQASVLMRLRGQPGLQSAASIATGIQTPLVEAVDCEAGLSQGGAFAGRVLRGESLSPSPVPRRAVL